MNPSPRTARQKTGNFLIGLCSFLLIFSSSLKFAHVPKAVAQMSSMGFTGDKLLFVAVLEALTAIVFLTPAVRSFGVLVISSYLGGAIASHVASGQYRAIVTPTVCLTLAWLGTWLRHPQLLWSFKSSEAPGRRHEPARSSSGNAGMVFTNK